VRIQSARLRLLQWSDLADIHGVSRRGHATPAARHAPPNTEAHNDPAEPT